MPLLLELRKQSRKLLPQGAHRARPRLQSQLLREGFRKDFDGAGTERRGTGRYRGLDQSQGLFVYFGGKVQDQQEVQAQGCRRR